MLDADRVRAILSQAFPQLYIGDIRYLAAGWDFEVWEVDHRQGDGPPLLFRFPFREDCVIHVRRETRLLPALGKALPVALPRPVYHSEGCEAFGLPFFGYEKIEGVPLSDASLSDEQREDVGRQLGSFLSALHSFSIEQPAVLGIERHDARSWREQQRSFQEKCRASVLPLLQEHERPHVDRFFREFVERDEHFRFDTALLHADLGMDHVLVDEAQGCLTGLIDFGDAEIGDPALDFVGMSGEMRRAALSAYTCPLGDAFDARVAYMWKIGGFHDVMFGLGDGGERYVHEGLAGVRKRVLGGDVIRQTA